LNKVAIEHDQELASQLFGKNNNRMGVETERTRERVKQQTYNMRGPKMSPFYSLPRSPFFTHTHRAKGGCHNGQAKDISNGIAHVVVVVVVVVAAAAGNDPIEKSHNKKAKCIL
jgi:hypothetical protein